MDKIDKEIRCTNYLIDISMLIVTWIVLTVVFQASYVDGMGFYGLMFVYYFLFELVKGQTVGKMITKTIVVTKNGDRPKMFKILIRSILRLVPIDGFTYLFGTELGFHDILSSTKLVQKTA